MLHAQTPKVLASDGDIANSNMSEVYHSVFKLLPSQIIFDARPFEQRALLRVIVFVPVDCVTVGVELVRSAQEIPQMAGSDMNNGFVRMPPCCLWVLHVLNLSAEGIYVSSSAV